MPTRCTAHMAEGRPCRASAVRGSDPPRCVAHVARAHKRRAHPKAHPGAALPPNTAQSSAADAPGDAARPPGASAPPDAKAQPNAAAPDHRGLAVQIADLDRRIASLGDYIDTLQHELDIADLVRLNDLHSKMMSRVTRMRQVLNHLDPAGGGEQSALMKATYRALDQIFEEKRIEH